MIARLLYRGAVYRLRGGSWRGPDGATVHLLTWVTDDLQRRGEISAQGQDDLSVARRVAEELGDAEFLEGGGPRRI